MQVGSLVETVESFEELRVTYGFPYPKKGDILTVSCISPHHRKGMVLLNFEEKPDLIALSDKQVNGKPNFIEVLPPIDIQEVLEVKKKWQDGMLFQSPVIKREPQIKLK